MSQRVLITAGAAGIGREFARAFTANGAKVFVCDSDDKALAAWLKKSEDKALPALELYKQARQLGYRTYFITGRPEGEELRTATVKNLKLQGYEGYEKLYMLPDGYKEDSVIPYKSGRRQEIEKAGSKIVLNIGDQWSDLKGGFAEKTFKLPNPFYFIP